MYGSNSNNHFTPYQDHYQAGQASTYTPSYNNMYAGTVAKFVVSSEGTTTVNAPAKMFYTEGSVGKLVNRSEGPYSSGSMFDSYPPVRSLGGFANIDAPTSGAPVSYGTLLQGRLQQMADEFSTFLQLFANGDNGY